MNVTELFGFVFQHGENIGILSYLGDKIKSFYENDLGMYFDIKDEINRTDEVIRNPNVSDTIFINIAKILGNGFVDGQSFINEILYDHKFNKDHAQKRNDVYFQTLLDYKIENYNKIDICKKFNKLLTSTIRIGENGEKIEIKPMSDSEILQYWKMGNMYNADMILLKPSKSNIPNHFELYVIDYGLMTKYFNCQNNITYDNFKKRENNVNYLLKSKVSFSKLNVCSDLDANTIVKNIPEYLDYLNPMGAQEKWFSKLIQSGSYASSFVNFLLDQTNFFESGAILDKIVVGCKTGVDKTLLPIPTENILPKDIANYLSQYFEAYKTKTSHGLGTRIEDIYGMMNDSIRYLYPNEKYQDVWNMIGTNEEHCLSKEITGFNKISEERTNHSNKVREILNNESIEEIWLLGCPGIGKTTTITNYLMEKDKWLFFYSSPRTTVNDSVAQTKFLPKKDGEENDIVAINCDSKDPTVDEKGHHVKYVKFKANNKGLAEQLSSYKDHSFLLVDYAKHQENKDKNDDNMSYNEIREQIYARNDTNNSEGVLKRECEFAKYATYDDKLHINRLVLSCTTQSLKKVGKSNTVEKNINGLFYFVNSSNMLNVEQYLEFVSKWPIIIFTIDEITGDKHGAVFYSILKKEIKKIKNIIKRSSRLSDEQKKLFNVKIILADASITSMEATKKHILNNLEKNRSITSLPKIYYKEIDKVEDTVIIENNRAFINAFTFPASKIKYETHIISPKTEEEYSDKEPLLQSMSDRAIQYLIEHPNNEQVIIFIQNIEDNEKIKHILLANNKLKIEKEEIQVINSKMSYIDKEELRNSEKLINRKIFIMTSSAVRGIDFPLATCIIAEVPSFNIEMNLAEIDQLIYRGRGKIKLGESIIDYEDSEHSLIFYLNTPLYVEKNQSEEKRKLAKLYQSISVISILFILQASIYTRIFGYYKYKEKKYEIIPLGDIGIDTIPRSDYLKNINYLKTIRSEFNAHSDHLAWFGGPIVRQEIKDVQKTLYNSDKFIIPNILNKNFNSSIKNNAQYNYYDDICNRIKISNSGEELYNQLSMFNPFRDAYVFDNMIFVGINYGELITLQRYDVPQLERLLKLNLFTKWLKKDMFNREFIFAVEELKKYIKSVIKNVEKRNEDFEILDKQDSNLYFVCFSNIAEKEIKELNDLCKEHRISSTALNEKVESSIDNTILQRVKTLTNISSSYLINFEKVDYNYLENYPFALMSIPELVQLYSKDFNSENIYNSLNSNVISLMLLS